MPRCSCAALAAMLQFSLLAACQPPAPAGQAPSGPQPPGATGRVLQPSGVPIVGARVRVTGLAEQVTAEGGTFSLAGAPPIYDVGVVSNSNVATVYLGLSRPDPIVTPAFAVFGTEATLSGVSGVASGLTAGRPSLVSVEGTVWAGSDVPATDGAYSIELYQPIATDLPSTLHLLESTTGPVGLPASFTGHATTSVTLRPGQISTTTLALGPVTSRPITATVDEGGAVLSLWVSWPGGGAARVGDGTLDGTSASLATADVAGTRWAVSARAGSGGMRQAWRRGLSAGTSPGPLRLPAALRLTSPPDGATGVDLTTSFTWDAVPGAVYVVVFWSSAPSAPLYSVLTRETTARIPDLSWAGLQLPPSTSGEVDVIAVGPMDGADAAASLDGAVSASPNAWGDRFARRVPSFDGFATGGSTRFTTAP